MQPTTAQFCQQFQVQVGEIKRRLGQIPPDIVEQYLNDPNAVDKKLVDEFFVVAELRKKFMQEYLDRANYLFKLWAYKSLKWPKEIQRLEFDDSGRVEVEASRFVMEDADYFPTLIKKITGYVSIRGGVSDVPVDFLEEVDGTLSIEDSAVSSMRRLHRVTEELNATNSRVSDLGMLEEVEGFTGLNVENCKNLTNVQSLRRVKGRFKAKGTNISVLPSLETVTDDFEISGPFVSAPKLTEVGHEVPESRIGAIKFGGFRTGGMRIENTRVINFRKAFPSLRKVGKSSRENISFFISESQHFLAPQIKDLKDKGELDYSGQIMVGGRIYRMWGLPERRGD